MSRAGLVILLLALSSGTVRAEDTIEPKARAYLEQGVKLFEQGKYEDAGAQFRLGLAIQDHPDLLYGLAQTERLLGDCESALEHYLQVLEAVEEQTERAEAVRIQIDRCERTLEEERPEPQPTMTIPTGKAPENPPPRPRPVVRIVGWVLVGVGLAAAGVGTWMYVDGRSGASDAELDYQHAVDARDAGTRGNLGLGTGLAGLAVAAGGGVLVLRF
jgi:tetratricopeptide (TPR) repeat protein